MSKSLKILGLLLLIITMSCEENDILVSCAACKDTMPTETLIDIWLSESLDELNNYHLEVYRGKIEDNIMVMQADTRKSVHFTGMVNQEYSAIASFTKNGTRYKLINSTTPIVVDRSDYCERTCYIVKKNAINLRMKY